MPPVGGVPLPHQDRPAMHDQVPVDHDEQGQGLAEYALILSLIAITAIVALIFIGGAISGAMSRVGVSI